MRSYVKTFATIISCLMLAACMLNEDVGNPNNGLSRNKRAAADNIRLSAEYLTQGKMEIAKQKILTAQREAPDWPPVIDGLARFYASVGDSPQAMKYYRQAIRMDSHSGNLRNNYGAFLCSIGEYRDAVKQFNQAVEDQNYLNTAGAYENAGLCALKIPDNALAYQYFNKALQADPLRATALYEIANMEFQNGNFTKANNLIGRFSAVSEDNAESLWLKIQIAKKLRNFDLASSEALKLKSKFPNAKQTKLLKQMEQA